MWKSYLRLSLCSLFLLFLVLSSILLLPPNKAEASFRCDTTATDLNIPIGQTAFPITINYQNKNVYGSAKLRILDQYSAPNKLTTTGLTSSGWTMDNQEGSFDTNVYLNKDSGLDEPISNLVLTWTVNTTSVTTPGGTAYVEFFGYSGATQYACDPINFTFVNSAPPVIPCSTPYTGDEPSCTPPPCLAGYSRTAPVYPATPENCLPIDPTSITDRDIRLIALGLSTLIGWFFIKQFKWSRTL